MRKLPLGIAALAVFAVAPTFGATKGVEVTHAGFTPSKMKVDYGDTVTWTNRDTTSHQVVSDRGEFPASPVLEPNKTYTYTFMKSGNFGYRDASNPKNRGTVVVRTGVSIAAAPAPAVYGSFPTLSGFVSSGASGETVVLDGMQCGSTMFARVGSVNSTAEGRWRSPVKPVVNMVYQATWRNAKSVQLTEKVEPQFSFRRVRAHRFAVSVAAGTGVRREVRRPAALPRRQAHVEDREARQAEQREAGRRADRCQLGEVRSVGSAPHPSAPALRSGSGRPVLRGHTQRCRPGLTPHQQWPRGAARRLFQNPYSGYATSERPGRSIHSRQNDLGGTAK
jgi:plastocyanin